MTENALWRYSTLILFCLALFFASFAEKVLVYDPEKGIIFVEKNQSQPNKKPVTPTQSSSSAKSNTVDIHTGRKKDPPELYFRSGLEYFQNGDLNNALKNFSYADSVAPRPEYTLWKAKTLRQLGDYDKMLYLMHQIIENFPESNVADDALFELALHYQKVDDYERAGLLYSRLAEQYPFGVLYSTGEELREIAREQRKLMRAELINLLSILGYTSDDLNANLHSFQMHNQLELTANADQQTVRQIKNKHREFLKNEELQIQNKEKIKKLSFFLYCSGTISALLLLISIFLQLKIRSKKQHISELMKILKDLDLGKL